jgi:hypothetical protein
MIGFRLARGSRRAAAVREEDLADAQKSRAGEKRRKI